VNADRDVRKTRGGGCKQKTVGTERMGRQRGRGSPNRGGKKQMLKEMKRQLEPRKLTDS